MAAPSFYFHYQVKGGEDKWVLELATKRDDIVHTIKPAFVTVLDLSMVPDDNDWSKVRYTGPMYFDFDARGNLEFVCEQFKVFLNKLNDELGFDATQARLFLSGGKGMHIEIPEACFIAKANGMGTPNLPYIYRAVAESLMVDTLDTNVYTGKRGRMWRTPGVRRDNGNYKVPITLDVALAMTPELYAELCSKPQPAERCTPPTLNTKFAMLFDRSREKVLTHMRGKRKREAQANAVLDPYRLAKRTPPTIEGLMAGTSVKPGAGFQHIAMQLAIYAASVGMAEAEFIDRCKGLIATHDGDGVRYGSPEKRADELRRMLSYMNESTFYDFQVGPLINLVRPGVSVADLGVKDTTDIGDVADIVSSDPDALPDEDDHQGVRKGFFMNAGGMWRRTKEGTESICRATLRNVESFYDVERGVFIGYEFEIVEKGSATKRATLAAESFTSVSNLRKFFVNYQISFQGGDAEAMSLHDVMAEKAKKTGKVFVYPREGFFLINNPRKDKPDPVKVYLTKFNFLSSVKEDDEDYFRLRYRPVQATSNFNIDIHRAPELGPQHTQTLHDLFNFTRPDVLGDLIGWFTACHYRSFYLYHFNQFPLLQLWGEAGSGKSQSVLLLGKMHWYLNQVSMKSAASFTAFAIDMYASASTSAPLIIDEFKPRELRRMQGGSKYEKLKDIMKASYIGGDIGERGTLNAQSETSLSLVRNKATAPIIFIGESLEMETAIIERSVSVNLSKGLITSSRKGAWNRLSQDAEGLSALGRELVEVGFILDVNTFAEEVRGIVAELEAAQPSIEDESMRRMAPRMIFNRAVIIHSLRMLAHVLRRKFGSEFDEDINNLLNARHIEAAQDDTMVALHSTSEMSKVMSRIAMLSRESGQHYELTRQDYVVGEGWVELKVDRAYDQYRRFCASINDTPLFDNLESFVHALATYSPITDRVCMSSNLRQGGSTERIVRMNSKRLLKEGVQGFR